MSAIGVFEQLRSALADRYGVERELGHGGMALVFLAQDFKHHRQVAIKVLRPELAAALGAERFLREIAIAARLTHPHILPLHDSGEVHYERSEGPGFLYYVMPYVEGESLRDRLNRERQLPIDQAVAIARQVAAALDYAHSHDVVHRDIKPENILLVGDEVVVADFGIARAITEAGDRLTSTGIAVGTPAYMSPEQGSGEPHLDGRSDVFSLGCVLYEMLAGVPPFVGPTAQAIQARRTTDPVPPLRTVRETIPKAVEQAIEKALAKVPADRYATAAEFATSLEPAVQPILGGVPSLRRAMWRRSWRVVAGGVLLGGLAMAIWTVARPGAGSRPAPIRLAVLPFDNLSPDTADAYFAVGLSEQLSERLGQIERLRLSSRTAVRRFEGTRTLTPIALGRALGVDYFLTGGVRRSGAHLRVAVELVQAATGDRLWGNEYERVDGDPFLVEQDISIQVTTAIAGQLLTAEQWAIRSFPTRSREAYDHFLRGLGYLSARNPGAVQRAEREFSAAVTIDLTFAEAHAHIGIAYGLLLRRFAADSTTRDSLLTHGLEATNRALQLDSTISNAWVARGRLLAERGGPLDPRVFAAYERAIALNPRNPEAYHFYGIALAMHRADTAQARVALEHAVAIEPDRAVSLDGLAIVAFANRRYAEALRWWDSAVAIAPSPQAGYHANRAMGRLVTEDTAGARTDAATALELDPRPWAHAVLALADLGHGDAASARATLARLTAGAPVPDYGRGLAVAAILTALGRHEQAMDYLEQVRPHQGFGLPLVLEYPFLDPLRFSARFRRLAEEARQPVPQPIH